jgi:hypothetical protein
MKTILSIVPRLPPAIDGVGDYADRVARILASQHQISTKFIACDPLAPLDNSSNDSIGIQLEQRSADALLASLNNFDNIDTLLLHYVSYGYDKRGCPLWLVTALTKWRKGRSSRRIIVMFHEVYASSKLPWSSQFWTAPLQKKIAKDLANLSDRTLTNTQIYKHLISGLSGKHDSNIDVLPIFSTIGESVDPLPLENRNPWLVTFGNSGFRKSIYTDSIEQLTDICHQLGIQEIYDIGHNSSDIVRPIAQIKVNAMGILPATEISQIFSMAQVGFLNYPITYIAKSTIFAAYSSHQLLSVFDRHNLGDNQDGVNFREHYWAVLNSEDKIDLTSAQTIASNAYQWYERHNLDRVTSHISNILQEVANKPET